jgi:hypothetical protein
MIVPNELKCSIVRPVYKGDKHNDVKNYRPISILPAIEKIMEKYLSLKLNAYLKKHNLMDPSQHGFQESKSTETLLSQFSSHINSELNNKKHVLVLYVDNSKAFDTINHEKMLKMLECVGVRGYVLKLFQNYLNDRKITVKVCKHTTHSKNVLTGVPQGSILGPTMYIIFVSCMRVLFRYCKYFVYADDTALVVSHHDELEARRLLQCDYNKLIRWSHDYGLIINAKKTKLMYIRSPNLAVINPMPKIVSHDHQCIHRNVELPITCDCSCVDVVDNYVYLGLTIDNKFKWDLHVNKICKRLRSIAGKLYRIKYFVPRTTLKVIYKSLAESLIRYGIGSWGNCTNTNLKRVMLAQKSILRLIVSKNVCTAARNNISLYFKKLNILSAKGLFWQRIVLDQFLKNEYKIRPRHAHNTRFKLNEGYIVPQYNNKYGKRTLEYNVPKLLNTLKAGAV